MIKLWGPNDSVPGTFKHAVLRRYREAAKLSIEDVARACHVSYSTIRYIETGRHMPRADILAALVYELDVDPRELFEHRAQSPPRGNRDHH